MCRNHSRESARLGRLQKVPKPAMVILHKIRIKILVEQIIMTIIIQPQSSEDSITPENEHNKNDPIEKISLKI